MRSTYRPRGVRGPRGPRLHWQEKRGILIANRGGHIFTITTQRTFPPVEATIHDDDGLLAISEHMSLRDAQAWCARQVTEYQIVRGTTRWPRGGDSAPGSTARMPCGHQKGH